jgi:hypothetical protein
MPTVIVRQPGPYPTAIKFVRSFVVLATVVFAGWFDLAASGATATSPSTLLLSPTAGLSWLWQSTTAALTIPYSGFGLQMTFDLLILNFFLTPVVSFVFSFLTEPRFFRFLYGLIAVGIGSFWAAATLINGGVTEPCSLFSGLALAVVVFWCLLHKRGQSTLLLAFPISRTWALAVTAIVALYSPLTMGEWAHACSILSMAGASYVWAIARWKLRSYIDSIEKFEYWLDTTYSHGIRILEWHVFRHFRK